MEKKDICSLFRVVSFVIMAFSTSIKLLKQGSCASSSHDERILKVVENIHLRIKKEGGVVFQGRVFGTLILTRSLGDKEMKQYGVIAKPYCFSSLINENDLYVIIGSDGVWDALPNETLFELSKEKMSTDDFAKKIVMLSIDRGSTDNITCLVIKLN